MPSMLVLNKHVEWMHLVGSFSHKPPAHPSLGLSYTSQEWKSYSTTPKKSALTPRAQERNRATASCSDGWTLNGTGYLNHSDHFNEAETSQTAGTGSHVVQWDTIAPWHIPQVPHHQQRTSTCFWVSYGRKRIGLATKRHGPSCSSPSASGASTLMGFLFLQHEKEMIK